MNYDIKTIRNGDYLLKIIINLFPLHVFVPKFEFIVSKKNE